MSLGGRLQADDCAQDWRPLHAGHPPDAVVQLQQRGLLQADGYFGPVLPDTRRLLQSESEGGEWMGGVMYAKIS